MIRLSFISLIAIAAIAGPTSADASIFGKKVPPEDFSVARPLPVQPVPVVATGSIFQAQDGYAALYEGWRARKVGDPLTIVLVERTAASKSSGSKLDSNGGASITPPTTGALNLFSKSDASISGGRNFNGTGA
ncbi:flagellar basal body L-ring protein FlgH, partial [Nocardioides cavernae]|nr:flagellar basal body L-ring protein FlgH [Nocardioides cavernae]